MSQSQGIEARRLSRRTIATGAAWAVPVIAVGAAAPMAAASVCTPTFVIVPDESFKCCNNGDLKNLKVTFKVTDPSGCIESGDGEGTVTILKVALGNGKSPMDVNKVVAVNGFFTVFFKDVQSCPHFIDVTYSIGSGSATSVSVPADNIPQGNTTNECGAA
jgi:hypothetical protein